MCSSRVASRLSGGAPAGRTRADPSASLPDGFTRRRHECLCDAAPMNFAASARRPVSRSREHGDKTATTIRKVGFFFPSSSGSYEPERTVLLAPDWPTHFLFGIETGGFFFTFF